MADLSYLESPQVLSDNRVVFRIYAPKAGEVSIKGDWVPHGRGVDGPLQKDDRGVWSITVGSLEADLYTYLLTVDGVPTLDPGNPHIKHSADSRQNILTVPGEAMAFAATRPVPHGDVRIVWYESQVTQSQAVLDWRGKQRSDHWERRTSTIASAQASWHRARVPRKPRRTHVDQLASIPVCVFAAAVPGRARQSAATAIRIKMR